MLRAGVETNSDEDLQEVRELFEACGVAWDLADLGSARGLHLVIRRPLIHSLKYGSFKINPNSLSLALHRLWQLMVIFAMGVDEIF